MVDPIVYKQMEIITKLRAENTRLQKAVEKWTDWFKHVTGTGNSCSVEHYWKDECEICKEIADALKEFGKEQK